MHTFVCVWTHLIYTFIRFLCLYAAAHTSSFATLHFDACCVSTLFMCTFPLFASKPVGCTPIFARTFPIGHMHLFCVLERDTFRLLLCTQADDVHVATPVFVSLYTAEVHSTVFSAFFMILQIGIRLLLVFIALS